MAGTPNLELKLALAGAAVASTLGGWAALARSAPTPAPVQPAPVQPIQPAVPTQVPVQPAQPAAPQQVAIQPQPAVAQQAPRVVVVPTPRPATGSVAATTRSSR